MLRLSSIFLILLIGCSTITYKNYRNDYFDRLAVEIKTTAENIKTKELSIYNSIKENRPVTGIPGVIHYLDLAIRAAQDINTPGFKKELLITDIMNISHEVKAFDEFQKNRSR